MFANHHMQISRYVRLSADRVPIQWHGVSGCAGALAGAGGHVAQNVIMKRQLHGVHVPIIRKYLDQCVRMYGN